MISSVGFARGLVKVSCGGWPSARMRMSRVKITRGGEAAVGIVCDYAHVRVSDKEQMGKGRRNNFSKEGTSSVICYLMLTGRTVFRAEDRAARLQCMKLKPSLLFAQKVTEISSKSFITVIFRASAMSLIWNYVTVLPIC